MADFGDMTDLLRSKGRHPAPIVRQEELNLSLAPPYNRP